MMLKLMHVHTILTMIEMVMSIMHASSIKNHSAQSACKKSSWNSTDSRVDHCVVVAAVVVVVGRQKKSSSSSRGDSLQQQAISQTVNTTNMIPNPPPRPSQQLVQNPTFQPALNRTRTTVVPFMPALVGFKGPGGPVTPDAVTSVTRAAPASVPDTQAPTTPTTSTLKPNTSTITLANHHHAITLHTTNNSQSR
jgi:hypothetical protein